MSDFVRALAAGADALDRAGMFKEADVIDDMIRSVAAPLPAAPKTARVLLGEMNQMLGGLTASDTGASVALKAAKDLLTMLDGQITAAFQSKKSGEPVRVAAKDALNRFLAIANSENQAANQMFQPVVKPMVDCLQAMLRLPDQLIWS